MASSPVYSATDDEEEPPARKLARYDGSDNATAAASGSGLPGLTLEKMLRRLNEDGPLDVLLHVLVKDGSVCPFSTLGIQSLRGLNGAIEEAGCGLKVRGEPLAALLERIGPCKGHTRGLSLEHLRTHAEALAGECVDDGENGCDDVNALLHTELKLYLRRRGVTAADARKEKELERENRRLREQFVILQASHEQLAKGEAQPES